jgi:DNA-binding SARP family transcriptional activator
MPDGHYEFADMVSVRLLGQVDAWVGARPVDLGPARRRSLFALLALRVGQVVSLEEIVDGLWADTAPNSPIGNIYTYVNGLRRALDPERDSASPVSVLESVSPGYRLRSDRVVVDADRFTALITAGRMSLGSDLEAAVTQFDDALRLWRGDPLTGTSGPFVQAERLHLLGKRFGLLEDRATALLTLDRHDEAVTSLRELVGAYPLRERPRGLLMQALYRAGRSGEALAEFADVRAVLDRELGIDPSDFLGELRDRIAESSPALLSGPPRQFDPARAAPADAAPVVAGLPPAAPGFSGRAEELARLRELVVSSGSGAVIEVISGPAGVGKTALALQIAHELSDRFPDGQLFADLRGFDPHAPPLDSAQVLTKLLGDLGDQTLLLREGEAELSARFRSLLAGKRVLLVLDNALSSEQIRPLLPSTSCLVLITSRTRLDGLVARDGAKVLDLRPLRPEESEVFLAGSAGHERATTALPDLRRIAELCGHLPLALNIVARRLSSLPAPVLALSTVVAELADEGDRLDALSGNGEHDAVRTVFSWSYQALKPEPAQMFRRLGLYPGDNISTEAAAALNGTSVPDTRRLLETLANAHLIDWAGRGRYRIHDLLRLYTKELAHDEETPTDRDNATRRLLDWYLHTADNANHVLDPTRGARRLPLESPPEDCRPLEFAGFEQATLWAVAESGGLMSIVRHAYQLGHHAHVWKIMSVVWKQDELGPRLDDWVELKKLAVAAAEHEGDVYAQMWSMTALGYVYHYARRLDLAQQCFASCLDYWSTADPERPGVRLQEVGVLTGLAYNLCERQDLDTALVYCERALPIAREENDPESEIWTLSIVSMVYRKLGKLAEAGAVLRDVLVTGHVLGWTRHLLDHVVLRELGKIERELGRFEQAAACLNQALSASRELNNPLSEVRVLYALGEVLRDLGQIDRADTVEHQADDLMEKFAIPVAALDD